MELFISCAQFINKFLYFNQLYCENRNQMINSGQKNRLELSHKKGVHVDAKNAKPKSTKKPLSKGRISQSKSKKNLATSGEDKNVLIKSASTNKGESNFSNDKHTKMITHSQSCQLLRSKSKSKQHISKDQKSKEKKQSPYILNPLSNSKSHNSLSLNRGKQNTQSHFKIYSNHTSTKNISNQSYDMSSFTKSTADITKMKKKSHNYIKSFNKTTIQNKGCSKFENIQNGNISRSCKSGKMRTNTEGLENIRQFQITDAELDGANLEFCPKISQIRQNVNNLFKKLKEPIRNKLLLITNNYQKIVSQLYQKINKSTDEIPNFELSNIQYTHSISGTDEESKVTKQNIVKIKDFSPSTSAMYDDCSESEHWDSYLEAERKGKTQNIRKNPVSLSNGNKQNLVKKLNLGDVKKMQIKQYQDEFMDNQQVFSESWKRQINQQKRF